MALPEIRVRTKIPDKVMEEDYKARVVSDDDVNFWINPTKAAKVFKPDGRPLCTYLPGAVKADMDAVFDILVSACTVSENRGTASGTAKRVKQNNQMRASPVSSSVIGTLESGHYNFCRLTSWSSKHVGTKWPELFPFFQSCARLFQQYVPDRYEAQMEYARKTPSTWLIPDSPYTTVTLNDTWYTAVHKDQGDLDVGFSCIAVARRGEYTGGALTFPQYGIGVDAIDGSLLLMDAHDWHGNTKLYCKCGKELGISIGHGGTGACKDCGAQRVSAVLYYRTATVKCGTAEEEQAKALAWAEKINVGSGVEA